MFLQYLSKECKPLFLDLCIYAANANGEFSDEEKTSIDGLANEMMIESIREPSCDSLDMVVDRINKYAINNDKNIICFEVLGVLASDGVVDEDEKAFELNLMEKLGCDVSKYDEMASLLKEFFELSLRIGQCIVK